MRYNAYQQFIERVWASYPAYQESTEYDKDQLVWCDHCQQQINLWSYWQGSLDAVEFTQLIQDLNNHTHKHSNRGYTPVEMQEVLTKERNEPIDGQTSLLDI